MKVELLQQAAEILSPCGFPYTPGAASAVPIGFGLVFPMVLNPGGAVTLTKEIPGRDPWQLTNIQNATASASLVGIRLQIQLPNGRYLFGGNGVDVGQFSGLVPGRGYRIRLYVVSRAGKSRSL